MKKLFSRLFQTKPKWNFCAAELTETTDVQKNPARGWYTIYPFLLEEEPDFQELYWCLRKEETLALVIVNIGAYREQALDSAAVERLRKILHFFTEHSYDILLRIVYDHEGNALEREPFFFQQVLEHIDQLIPVVKEFACSVFVWQGMLIGNWGEMHTSRFLSPEKMKQLWSRMKAGVGDGIFLAVRRPAMWRLLHPEECGKAQLTAGRTGLFDDAIFGSDSHMGTFGTEARTAAAWDSTWCRQEELAFEDVLCQQVPNGGEAVCGEEYAGKFTAAATAQVLQQMHITYLNQAYDEKILNQWKEWHWEESGAWKGRSLYDYIGAHLGYRFCIRSISVTPIERSEKARVSVMIENTGFASFYQEAEVLLSWEEENGESGEKILPVDIRSWNSSAVQKVTFSVEPKNCHLYLSIRRKTDGRKIFFANRNSREGVFKEAGNDGMIYLGTISGV